MNRVFKIKQIPDGFQAICNIEHPKENIRLEVRGRSLEKVKETALYLYNKAMIKLEENLVTIEEIILQF